jgi:fibronectin-binding autotransporter adhesin
MPFISSIRKKYDTPNQTENPFEVTGGDVVYTAGGYKIHMFTNVGNSSLNISHKTNLNTMSLLSSTLDAEVMVIAGGGSGGSRHGGGGGAGGMVVSNTAQLTLGNYATTVGAGGASFTGDRAGERGGNSIFGAITAVGGGGGGNWGTASPTAPRFGGPGGSGGGSGARPQAELPGQSTQPTTGAYNSLGFGFPGGTDRDGDAGGGPNIQGGGGGGAGAAGENGPGERPRAGTGGPGRANSILGVNYFWAGGGGGGTWNGADGGNGGRGGGGGGAGGAFGIGGGGALNNGSNAGGPYPGTSTGTVGGNGGTNTGGGGGGANQTPSTSGAGGPGIVVVRYRI